MRLRIPPGRVRTDQHWERPPSGAGRLRGRPSAAWAPGHQRLRTGPRTGAGTVGRDRTGPCADRTSRGRGRGEPLPRADVAPRPPQLAGTRGRTPTALADTSRPRRAEAFEVTSPAAPRPFLGLRPPRGAGLARGHGSFDSFHALNVAVRVASGMGRSVRSLCGAGTGEPQRGLGAAVRTSAGPLPGTTVSRTPGAPPGPSPRPRGTVP